MPDMKARSKVDHKLFLPEGNCLSEKSKIYTHNICAVYPLRLFDKKTAHEKDKVIFYGK